MLQVAYAASDQVLATAGYDQAVCMWDCRSNNFNAMQTMKVFADSVTSVACTARYRQFLLLRSSVTQRPQY